MFSTDTLQQEIEITDLKPLLAADNTSVVITLATAVYYFYRITVMTMGSFAFQLCDQMKVSQWKTSQWS